MPLIRYRIGDRATWAECPCACGRAWPLLAQVDGRVMDAFTTPGGGPIDGCYFTMGFFGLDSLKQFQVVQETPELLRACIVPRDPSSTREPRWRPRALRRARAHRPGPGLQRRVRVRRRHHTISPRQAPLHDLEGRAASRHATAPRRR